MTYTSHGHHIPGTILDSAPSTSIVRCGGIRLCRVCKAEAFVQTPYGTRTWKELRDDLAAPLGETDELPLSWCRRRIENFPFMFFDGSEDSVHNIRKWMANNQIESSYWPGQSGDTVAHPRESRIEFITHSGQRKSVLEGHYVMCMPETIGYTREDNSPIVVPTFHTLKLPEYEEEFESASPTAPVPPAFPSNI